RILLNRGVLNECYNLWLPSPTGAGFIYQIQALAYFDPAAPPDTEHLMRGLSKPAGSVPFRDMSYLDWELGVDGLIDFFRASFQWDQLIKPWFDVWLPESVVEQY